MHQQFWTFEQDTASTTWNVNNIPDGAVEPVITHIKTVDGQILQPDNQLVAPDGLQLSFGVEPQAGIAYGTYFTDDVVINGNGGVINVTINQTNPRV